jgi:Mg2+ and Co2+ transporter CorA
MILTILCLQVKISKSLFASVAFELLLEVTGIDAIADAITDTIESLRAKIERIENRIVVYQIPDTEESSYDCILNCDKRWDSFPRIPKRD